MINQAPDLQDAKDLTLARWPVFVTPSDRTVTQVSEPASVVD